jgi:hypothetical protein
MTERSFEMMQLFLGSPHEIAVVDVWAYSGRKRNARQSGRLRAGFGARGDAITQLRHAENNYKPLVGCVERGERGGDSQGMANVQ